MRLVRVLRHSIPTYGELCEDPDGITQIKFFEGNPIAGSASHTGETQPLDSCELLAPVVPSKIIGIGDNFLSPGEKREPFSAPLAFLKPSSAACGPDDLIVRPEGADSLTFEGELAVIMKDTDGKISESEVDEAIFGYTIANDVSAQPWQRLDSQWFRAKGANTFCPLGPWINTDLSVQDASNLDLETHLSGKLVQSSNTAYLKRTIPEIISFLSEAFSFVVGDAVLMGTPEGAGPMRDGDSIEIRIEHLGTLKNTTGCSL